MILKVNHPRPRPVATFTCQQCGTTKEERVSRAKHRIGNICWDCCKANNRTPGFTESGFRPVDFWK